MVTRGLNLHGIVRGAITSVHPDVMVQLLRSKGSRPNEDGKPVPTFERLSGIRAQIQSENDAALFHADMAGANTITRKIYLFSPKSTALQPASPFRPLSRSGDYVVQKDGTVWMVNAVIENFADVGWVSVRATLQVKPPDGVEWL
nr:MAG TPA: head closure knob [Caudoviricetes sp.]